MHIRGGRIVPYQNATALAVSKSQDLINAQTELIVLANKVNAPITVAPNTYTAQAAGLIYLDDGLSAEDTGRWDFAVKDNGDGTFTIDFTTVKDLAHRASAGTAGQLKAVTFLWASATGYKDITKAQIFETGGAQIDLDQPVYDADTDTMRVNLKNNMPGKVWSFWNIDKIIIQ